MTHLFLAVALAVEPSTTARQIVYYETETPIIYTQIGYVTVVILPKNEKIMWDKQHPIHCGNCGNSQGGAGFFEVTAVENVLYIHPMDLPASMDPKTGGKATNVDIELASGNHMEFIAREVSRVPGIHADLKVFVTEGNQSQIAAAQGPPKYVPADELEAARKQLTDKEEALQALRTQRENATQKAALTEAQSIKHGYELYEQKGKPFHLMLYRDDRFTYAETDLQGREAPTFWEIKDGKLAKIDALLENGKYTVSHLVDEGEFRAGKSSVKFRFVKE